MAAYHARRLEQAQHSFDTNDYLTLTEAGMRSLRTGDESLRLEWDACDREAWQELLARAGKSGLEQSWAYGAAHAARHRVHVRRLVLYCGRSRIALAQFLEHRLPIPLRPVWLLRGPVILDPAPTSEGVAAVFAAVKAAVRLAHRELLVWTPELPMADASHELMRRCRMRRMITGYSSVWLDLDRSDDELRAGLHGKWRNMLVAAENTGLGVRLTAGGRDLDWLLANYDTFRKKARFAAPPGALVKAMAEASDRGQVMTLTAVEGREPVAGILVLCHGVAATYLVSWTGEAGRRHRANYLLLWRAMSALRRRGVRWLDLGGVDTTHAPGVARFKLGLGGELFTLTGTYI